MIYDYISGKGQHWRLPQPVSIQIDWEEDSPAASFKGTFPMGNEKLFGGKIQVTNDSGKTVFIGMLDEIRTFLGNSAELFLQARSPIGILLDSEAMPITYPNPSLQILFSACAKPYGFHLSEEENEFMKTPYSVEKGKSEWQALNGFCKKFLGKPLFADGWTLSMERSKCPTLILGDNGKTILEEIQRQSIYQRVSAVYGKEQNNWKLAEEDTETKSMGILRRRFSVDPQATLQKALKKEETMQVLCAGAVAAHPLQSVWLHGKSDWVVSAVRYCLNGQGESTRLTLRKEKLKCG
ncbi:hypothetical protein [Caproicibacterium sp. BJN0003]|uniref:hypothetical protein n=1 Tax=Caproicibacterium sp. BJN0003 TaxID=2994078 RepID=UPI00224CA41A|nr:hypothetical protein [Caproicibacterium sp. BJN0003]UZT82431.1 hypothetical protein OP489_01075 [Caproicibacterium sp. BJN0003]